MPHARKPFAPMLIILLDDGRAPIVRRVEMAG